MAAGQSSLRGMHEVFGACPLDCPDGCSWVVTVDDEGRAVNLKGNREHPFTAGALCAKVNGYLEHTRAADRILHPLKRVGRQGRGTVRADQLGRGAGDDRAAACTRSATSSAARRSGRSRGPGRSATSRDSRAAPASGCGTCSARRGTT